MRELMRFTIQDDRQLEDVLYFGQELAIEKIETLGYKGAYEVLWMMPKDIEASVQYEFIIMVPDPEMVRLSNAQVYKASRGGAVITNWAVS